MVMMLPSTAPPTPDNASPISHPGLRRSFTVPAQLTNGPRTASAASNETAGGIETLFTHTFAKVVSFSTASSITRPTSSMRRANVDLDIDTPGSIPWASYTERTLAAGPLRVYRVTSSNISFLHSGRFLHSVFPKSQCWCVDGESKFVLRVRQDSYYRIELPFTTDDDKAKVEEFKAVLGKVLQYEKTACPFKRGFHVDLPEPTETPVRKRPWKPPEKAKKWLFDKAWVPEDGPRPVIDGSDSATSSSYDEDDRESVKTSGTNEERSDSPITNEATPPRRLSVLQRAKTVNVARSITALPQMSTGLSPPPNSMLSAKPAAAADPDGGTADHSADAVSVSSVDSFYSLGGTLSQSSASIFMDATSFQESNPWVSEQEEQDWRDEASRETERPRGRHRRHVSDITITAHSRDNAEGRLPLSPTDAGGPSSTPSTPPLMSDSEDSFEPPLLDVPTPPDTIRLRKLTGASQRRAFSPMPHPQNLFRPPSQAPPRNQLSAALVQKTCAILLGPPAHLVALMLRIAAKISNGAFGFNTYRVPRDGERIPCSWESSGDEEEWHEDDFGIPLGNLEATALRKRELGSAWEVD